MSRLPRWQVVVKNPPASSGNPGGWGLILGSGRSPGEGNGNPLQYSCLENPKDWGAWRTESDTIGHPGTPRNTRDSVADKHKLTSHRSGGWKSKFKVRADLAPDKGFLAHNCCLFTGFLHGRKRKGALWDLFIRALIPLTGVPPS